jgi:hypothetical protein
LLAIASATQAMTVHCVVSGGKKPAPQVGVADWYVMPAEGNVDLDSLSSPDQKVWVMSGTLRSLFQVGPSRADRDPSGTNIRHPMPGGEMRLHVGTSTADTWLDMSVGILRVRWTAWCDPIT